MAMGTTSHPQDNPQMHAPAHAAAAPHDAKVEIEESKLSDDDDKVDWVMLMRLYPHAKSKDELRSLALAAGKEAMTAAAHAKANKDVPIPASNEPGGTQ